MTNMVQRYARQRPDFAGNWKPSYLRKVIRVPEKNRAREAQCPIARPGPLQKKVAGRDRRHARGSI